MTKLVELEPDQRLQNVSEAKRLLEQAEVACYKKSNRSRSVYCGCTI